MRISTRLLTMTALCSALSVPAFAQVSSTAIASEGAETRSELTQGLDDRRWYPASGSDLAALIKDCEDASCMSYVAGAISGLSTRAHLFGQEHPFCSGDTVNIRDIRDAIVTVVEGDPELATSPSTFAIMAAFAATWPCDEDGNASLADAQEAGTPPAGIPIDAMTALEAGSSLTILANTPNALVKGGADAGILNTLTVFHDPNCPHCATFRAQTDALVEQGWQVRVIPVGILSEDSQGYSALMAAFAQSRPDAVEALYRAGVPGQSTVASGLQVLADIGISAPEALSAVSQTKAYDTVKAHEDLLFKLGGKGTPTWVLGDYLATGGAPAADIAELATRLPTPPGALGQERPTQPLGAAVVEPMIVPGDTPDATQDKAAESAQKAEEPAAGPTPAAPQGQEAPQP